MHTRSPLAPDSFPYLPAIDGLGLAVAASGSKYKGRDDLLLMTLCESATVAGVFTRSDTAAAPVQWCRDHIVSGTARAILTNAGNANAFTGQHGEPSGHRNSLQRVKKCTNSTLCMMPSELKNGIAMLRFFDFNCTQPHDLFPLPSVSQ